MVCPSLFALLVFLGLGEGEQIVDSCGEKWRSSMCQLDPFSAGVLHTAVLFHSNVKGSVVFVRGGGRRTAENLR